MPTYNRIYGNIFANLLVGTGAADLIRGLAGNDTIDGGLGRDMLFGDEGDDVLRGGNDLGNTLDGGDGNLQGADTITMDGGSGFDLVKFVTGSPATFDFRNASITNVEGIIAATPSDNVNNTVTASFSKIEQQARSGTDADMNAFVAILGSGTDTLTFATANATEQWTLAASALNLTNISQAPALAFVYTATEMDLINKAYNGVADSIFTTSNGAINAAIGLDCFVFQKDISGTTTYVTVWTDADSFLY
ncbi:MAG: hypothetical protein U1E46_11670 [Hyphomicrobiales bacterium]